MKGHQPQKQAVKEEQEVSKETKKETTIQTKAIGMKQRIKVRKI